MLMAYANKMVDFVHKIILLYYSSNYILLAEQAIFLPSIKIKYKFFFFADNNKIQNKTVLHGNIRATH